MVPHQDAGHGEKVREDDPDPDPVRARHLVGPALVPDGPTRGQQMLLSPGQRAQVRAIYDDGKREPVAAPLAAYLALLHVAGPMAREDPPPPNPSAPSIAYPHPVNRGSIDPTDDL
jgi:hypothetical protein